MPTTSECRHCGRPIVLDPDGYWIDPAATGDDIIWRETCDSHDTFTAEHEPDTFIRDHFMVIPVTGPF